jgi:hypothetical protein
MIRTDVSLSYTCTRQLLRNPFQIAVTSCGVPEVINRLATLEATVPELNQQY